MVQQFTLNDNNETMNSIKQSFENVNKGKHKGEYNVLIVKYDNDINENDVNDINVCDVIVMKRRDIFTNMQSVKYNKKGTCTDEEKIYENQCYSAWRGKTKVKRLIRENHLKYHWVIEYGSKGGMVREEVLNDFKNFIKRLEYEQDTKILYVAVPEIQPKRFKRSGFRVYHIHIALAIRIDIREFWSAWNNKKCLKCEFYTNKRKNFKCNECERFKGIVWVSYRDNLNIEKIAGYFGKYFSKGFEDEELNQREFMQKRYLNSTNLKMPKVSKKMFSDEMIDKLKRISEYTKDFPDGGSYSSVKVKFVDDIVDE